jgi:two-component system chemotaxis sensor kinase CheA
MAQDPFKYFRVEANELVDQLGKGVLELERSGTGVLPKLLRLAHTLKGAARVVRRPDIAEHAHAIEDQLAPWRDSSESLPRQNIDTVLELLDRIAAGLATLAPPTETEEGQAAAPVAGPTLEEDGFRTIWAEVGELDVLLEGVTETHAQLSALRRTTVSVGRARLLADQLLEQIALKRDREGPSVTGSRGDRTLALAEELRTIVGRLDRGIGAAQERMERELSQVHDVAEQFRLVPAGALFTFLERAARDTARAVGKLVTFEGKGGEVRLDAHVLRVMHEALLQVVRNAVAHGIESETARRLADKPTGGRVMISVVQRGRRGGCRCDDDGCGINVEAVRRAAARKGLRVAEGGDTANLAQMLLNSGISTSSAVTEVAGRGVGMDVVREALARLGGSMTVDTAIGRGTAFELVVPLTLASAEALFVDSEGLTVAIPFDTVRHVLHLTPRDIYRTAQGDEIVYEGHSIPFVHLSRLLGNQSSVPNNRAVRSAVIVAGATYTAALGVERLRGTGSVVFRSLPALTPANAVIAGASLDADGNPQLVLDPDVLVSEAQRHGAAPEEAAAPQRPVLIIDDSLTTRMLEQSILESAGYDVDLATSAEAGLESARRRQYSLFLVDVEMPGMDGFTFIERIRSDPALRDIPAILVTSRNAAEDKRRGDQVGAQGYVVKSEFNQAELLGRIRELTS